MSQNYDVKESDVLVIGGGMGGLWSAIRAKDFVDNVILVDKAKVTRSGASIHCHAYQAPIPEELFESKMKELVQRSGYLGHQGWFEVMLREIGDRMNQMEKWGVHFERDEKGNLKHDAIRGQSKGSCLIAHGKQVIEAIAKEALRKGVKFVERIAIIDLLTSDGNHPTQGHIVGAVGIHTVTGQFVVFRSKAVVIATGALYPKLHYFAMENVTGDGYAMAYRAGADITNLEVGLGGLIQGWNKKFIISGTGQFQHGGAKLVNSLGVEFLHKYDGASKEFIGFEGHFDQGAICRAMIVEYTEGRGPCYFDCRGWSEEKIANLRKVLPLTMKAFDEPKIGVNLKKQPVEVYPMVRAYGGNAQSGIRINILGESTIGGLYAAGVAACYGGGPLGQSLGTVGGFRAGENAAKWARDVELHDIISNQVMNLKEAAFAPLSRSEGISPDEIFYSVNKVVTPWNVSLTKSEKSIKSVLTEIRGIATDCIPKIKVSDIHELVKAIESKNFVLLMELLYIAALERKESRITHYREDYPFTDDQNWRKWIILKSNKKNGIEVKIEPVPLGCSGIVPDKYTKKPVQI